MRRLILVCGVTLLFITLPSLTKGNDMLAMSRPRNQYCEPTRAALPPCVSPKLAAPAAPKLVPTPRAAIPYINEIPSGPGDPSMSGMMNRNLARSAASTVQMQVAQTVQRPAVITPVQYSISVALVKSKHQATVTKTANGVTVNGAVSGGSVIECRIKGRVETVQNFYLPPDLDVGTEEERQTVLNELDVNCVVRSRYPTYMATITQCCSLARVCTRGDRYLVYRVCLTNKQKVRKVAMTFPVPLEEFDIYDASTRKTVTHGTLPQDDLIQILAGTAAGCGDYAIGSWPLHAPGGAPCPFGHDPCTCGQGHYGGVYGRGVHHAGGVTVIVHPTTATIPAAVTPQNPTAPAATPQRELLPSPATP